MSVFEKKRMVVHFRKEKKLIIFGINDFAEIAYEYFMHDSAYEVMAFTVDRAYATSEKKFGLPVIPFEEIDQILPPAEHEIFAAVWYSDMNRLRRGVLEKARAKQYRLASYISSKAEIWHDAQIGEHCFILENCIVQPFAVIGENVVIWSGSHIGHHVRIGSHSFFSSGVILSGHSSVGSHCFVGVNCAFSNYAQVGEGSR